MSNFVLKGHVSYSVKKRYKWIADFGKNTCKKCAELNGREFDEDDVPFWPHPNCRCKVEEISVVDDITAEINEYKEELQQLKLQANELLGDSRVTRAKLENLLREHPTKEVKALDIKLVKIEFDVYKLIDKIEAYTIDTISKFEISRVQKRIEELDDYIDNVIKSISDIIVNSVGSIPALEDAKEFYNIASKPQKLGDFENYIRKNGKIVSKISDLNNYKLETYIKTKIKQQYNLVDSRGVVYHSNSSPAKVVTNSKEFRTYIRNNKDKLVFNRFMPNTSLALESTFNNILTYHRCDLIDIMVDSKGVLKATVIDTVDYNANEFWVLMQRHLQEKGKLENYYVVVNLEIPQSEWLYY